MTNEKLEVCERCGEVRAKHDTEEEYCDNWGHRSAFEDRTFKGSGFDMFGNKFLEPSLYETEEDKVFYDCDGNSSSDDICECGHEKYEHDVFSQGREEARYCLKCSCKQFSKKSESETEDEKEIRFCENCGKDVECNGLGECPECSADLRIASKSKESKIADEINKDYGDCEYMIEDTGNNTRYRAKYFAKDNEGNTLCSARTKKELREALQRAHKNYIEVKEFAKTKQSETGGKK